MKLPAKLLTAAMMLAASVAAHPDDTMTGSLQPGFFTVQIRPTDASGMPYDAPPVMSLDGSDGILMTFDELSDDRRFMRYELVHYNALWQPDGLVDSEFLDGFNQADVTNFAFSQATGVHYVNYAICLPNEQMMPTISGNYLLRVYPEDDPDTTLVQARFYVTEGSARIDGSATSRGDYDIDGRLQQLTIAVDTRDLGINDPFNDLRIVVDQDGRTDNAVTVTHPLRLEGSKAIFEHSRDLTFDAGNEYRRFEIINEHYPTMGVASIDYIYPLYHYTLYADEPRADGVYSYDFSNFGRYVIRRQGSADSDTEADYAAVHFALAMPQVPGYSIHIEGDLTQRRLDANSLMTYNPETGMYEAAFLLKQGAYSYRYIAVPDSGGPGLTGIVEGDYYPTQHLYNVYAYYRRPGDRYDRLAAVCTLRY